MPTDMPTLIAILAAFALVSPAGVALAVVYVKRTWPSDLPYTLEYLDKSELGPYYLSLATKLIDYPNRDEHGGILEYYALTQVTYFHAIRNTHYAFALYEEYLKTSSEDLQREFLKMADAIRHNGAGRDEGSIVWHYPHQYYEGQTVPWISAMAQGQVVGVMARAFELTGEDRYLACAKGAFLPFLKKICDGGVCCNDPSLGVFYEEYAFAETEYQDHTLNGMTSALFGIYDYWKISQSEDARRVFDEGVATIKRNLPKYDFPFCSSYDLRHCVRKVRPVFNCHYNGVHVAHLHVLAGMTQDAYFDGVADCWDTKLRDKTNRLRMAIMYVIWKVGHVASRLNAYQIKAKLVRMKNARRS